MTSSPPRSAPPSPPSRSAPQGPHPRPRLGFLRRNPQQPAMARPELPGSVTGIAQVTTAWRWRRRQEGTGLALLEEEEEGAHLAAGPALLEEEGQEGSTPRATKRSCPSSSTTATTTHCGRR